MSDLDMIGSLASTPLDEHNAGVLASILKAIASPSRLQMLWAMAGREDERRLAAKDFQPITGLSQPCIANHTRLLEDAGLVTLTRHRGFCYYEIDEERLRSVADILRSLQTAKPSRTKSSRT